MSLRLKRIFRKWDDLHSESGESDSISFAVDWVKNLEDVLFRHRNDKEFLEKIILSASSFFSDKMSDQEKHDAFLFLLGRTVRRR